MHIPAEIFKAYDIRGIVGKSLNADIIRHIGHALGSEALARGQHSLCLGYDGRLSSPELAKALAQGLLQTGVDVMMLGMVTTPMLYFAAYHLNTHSGVMLTGSHNPPEYNGLKMVLADETLSEASIMDLRERLIEQRLSHGTGTLSHIDISAAYLERISQDIKLARPMHIAIDCGNGVAGAFAQTLYEQLGCTVDALYCEVDGHFPNHHPDPCVAENLQDLIQQVKNSPAEVGLAFDGDGDRLGVVSAQGEIIASDRQLMLFADDVLREQAGASVVFDVKCSRNVAPWITARGGVPIMWKTGHALMKAKMQASHAALAGEVSGHIYFKHRWYGFDDGLYAGARLLEILSRSDADILARLPDSLNTPEQHIKMQEGEPHQLIAQLQHSAQFSLALAISQIDGLRVEYADGFGLMRASNTTPVLVLRFEADNQTALNRIQNDFRSVLLQVMPHLQLPF